MLTKNDRNIHKTKINTSNNHSNIKLVYIVIMTIFAKNDENALIMKINNFMNHRNKN